MGVVVGFRTADLVGVAGLGEKGSVSLGEGVMVRAGEVILVGVGVGDDAGLAGLQLGDSAGEEQVTPENSRSSLQYIAQAAVDIASAVGATVVARDCARCPVQVLVRTNMVRCMN